MKSLFVALFSSSLVLTAMPLAASAMDCYVDPVYQYSGSGTIKSAVFLRSEACVTGTMALRTLSAGARVEVVGYTDGWYEVVSGDKRGWVGEQFLTSDAHATDVTWSSYEEYRSHPPTSLTPTDLGLNSAHPSPDTYVRRLLKLACPNRATVDDPCKAVYYIGADGKRHAFPNSRVFATWYANFDSVATVSSDIMSSIPLGMNITYRPGTRMVKFTTDPKTYAVGRGGVLRWVKSEALAIALYGANWNTKIDDIPDTFYANYNFGADIETEADFSPTTEQSSTATFD